MAFDTGSNVTHTGWTSVMGGISRYVLSIEALLFRHSPILDDFTEFSARTSVRPKTAAEADAQKRIAHVG
jgi:hypothetical protein